ncbi:MAG TPA: hypothetical protein VEA63_06510, partial [Opitutus sp.]|nr:hypothetical protein [Opitutus sp.]
MARGRESGDAHRATLTAGDERIVKNDVRATNVCSLIDCSQRFARWILTLNPHHIMSSETPKSKTTTSANGRELTLTRLIH